MLYYVFYCHHCVLYFFIIYFCYDTFIAVIIISVGDGLNGNVTQGQTQKQHHG